MEELGHGQFGDVFKALLDESSLPRGAPEYLVAAKTVRDPEKQPEGREELLKEVSCCELMLPRVQGIYIYIHTHTYIYIYICSNWPIFAMT